jgi:hypothetical protein
MYSNKKIESVGHCYNLSAVLLGKPTEFSTVETSVMKGKLHGNGGNMSEMKVNSIQKISDCKLKSRILMKAENPLRHYPSKSLPVAAKEVPPIFKE